MNDFPLPISTAFTGEPQPATTHVSGSKQSKRSQARPMCVHALELGMGWFPHQPGGLNRYFYELMRSLPATGVAARGLYVGSEPRGDPERQLRATAPCEVSILRRWKMMREAVREELSSRQVDLVCSHFALYARPVLPLVADLPHVVHFHGPWADECSVEGVRSSAIRRIFAWMRRSIERSVYRRANRFIVLSEAFKRILAESYGVNPALIEIIPGGVDIERFNPPQSRIEAREALGWPTDRPIVLAVRRLMTRMGLEELIDSAIDIRAQSPEALVLIAGRGRLGDVLADRVRRQGLSDHVRLTGYLPDDQLPLAYRGADLTVVPSIAMEGFGLVVVESLAAGTPVLVSDVGGLPEVVRDLSEAMVLDRAQPLGKQIESVLNGSLILPSSLECRDHAKRFDWPVIASRVADVYRNVACGRALAGETTTSSGAEIACEMSPGCA